MKIKYKNKELEEATQSICQLIKAEGGTALMVGGAVRDSILGIQINDIDIEIYNIDFEKVIEIIKPHFSINLFGESFFVAKVMGLSIDISTPRKESKVGISHTDFIAASDPTMSVEEAALRRDFTINSMAYNPITDKIFDPFNGISDLENKVLKHTSDKFSEDSLRVLRGMQFVARFDLTPDETTVALCKRLNPEDLSKERMFEEWKKLILKGHKISKGLFFLRDVGWLKYFPEIENLIGCEQDFEYHKEGDVFIHTGLCIDEFAKKRIGNDKEDLIVGLAVLCHDFGKPSTSQIIEGKIRFFGHETKGADLTHSFIKRLTASRELLHEVTPLVVSHCAPFELYKQNSGNAAVRRLARKVGRIDRLVRVTQADRRGRRSLTFDDIDVEKWLLEKATNLHIESSKPKPIVTGKYLIGRGMVEGPEIGKYLKKLYDAQIEGMFDSIEEGLEYFYQHILKDGTTEESEKD